MVWMVNLYIFGKRWVDKESFLNRTPVFGLMINQRPNGQPAESFFFGTGAEIPWGRKTSWMWRPKTTLIWIYWLVVNGCHQFHFPMNIGKFLSSSQLTFTPSFFRTGWPNHQPEYVWVKQYQQAHRSMVYTTCKSCCDLGDALLLKPHFLMFFVCTKNVYIDGCNRYMIKQKRGPKLLQTPACLIKKMRVQSASKWWKGIPQQFQISNFTSM